MISVIVPTLNEEKGILKTIKRIPKNVNGEKVEILVIDGLSTDNTVDIAKKGGAKIILEKKKGKGMAMRTGVDKAMGDKIVFIDGDGSYPAEHIPKMIKLLNDCDVVVASRHLLKPNVKTSEALIWCDLLPKLLYKYYVKFKTSEPLTGMRAMRKKDWYKLNLKANDFLIETEMEVAMIKSAFKIIEIPIPWMDREGKSKFATSVKDWIKIRKFIIRNNDILNKNAEIYKIIDYK